MTRTWGAALILAGGALLVQNTGAQNTGVQRTVVQKGDVSVPGREAVIANIDITSGSSTGRHTHPGDEITYVSQGELEVTIDGQKPHVYKAGEGFVIPGGSVHNAKNVGAQPVKAVGVYVVEKGKPLATPAP
jgi:quercetin dioxygenase-like cupin family protein